MVKPEKRHTHFYYKYLYLVSINSARNLQKSVFKKKKKSLRFCYNSTLAHRKLLF